MVTVAIFQRWYPGAVRRCFPLDKWTLLPISLSMDTLSAEIDQLRQQAREGTTAAIDELFSGADEYGFLRMISVGGHNGLEVWVKLRRTDRLQVTVVYWSHEPFGEIFFQALREEWPELEDSNGDVPIQGDPSLTHFYKTLDKYAGTKIPKAGWDEIQVAIDALPELLRPAHSQIAQRLVKAADYVKNQLRVS